MIGASSAAASFLNVTVATALARPTSWTSTLKDLISKSLASMNGSLSSLGGSPRFWAAAAALIDRGHEVPGVFGGLRGQGGHDQGNSQRDDVVKNRLHREQRPMGRGPKIGSKSASFKAAHPGSPVAQGDDRAYVNWAGSA
jgi:hypothetical protein